MGISRRDLISLGAAMSLCSVGRALAVESGNDVLTDVDSAVLGADDRWARSERDGDISGLDRLLLPGFTLVDQDGIVYSKAGYIDSIRQTRFLSYAVTDRMVQGLGDVAIVTGQWQSQWTYDGQDGSGRFRFMAVISRSPQDGVWRPAAEAVVKLRG